MAMRMGTFVLSDIACCAPVFVQLAVNSSHGVPIGGSLRKLLRLRYSSKHWVSAVQLWFH